MMEILNKIFFRSNNLKDINAEFLELKRKTGVEQIFNAIENYSEKGEIRYVGGCVRKILKKQKVNDIDLATNLIPEEVIEVLKKNKIKYYETGLKHGTVTALINNYKFEITSLRKDVKTDGRHADVVFTNDWKEDASRRDFSINSIYSDLRGNLFDPFNGKKDLENGIVNFIGNPEKRIREDYLRILRYIRFFLNYSKLKHDENVIKIIKMNLDGFSKISSDRLLDEFKKLLISDGFLNLANDEFCYEIINGVSVRTSSDLNFFSKFIIDFSNEMPFFYGLFTIMFAIILGVGAAFIRRFISNFRKKIIIKS